MNMKFEKTPPTTKSHQVQELASEYRFEYKKAKPNRFATRMNDEPCQLMILTKGDRR